jgi:cytochrome c-type biogenesis protein
MTLLEERTQAEAKPPKPDLGNTGRLLGVFALVLLLVGGVSLGWLITGATGDADRPDATVLGQPEVTERLLRVVSSPAIDVEILYTPAWYFEWSSRAEPGVEDPAIGFFVFETIHEGVLPSDIPETVVTSNGVPLTMVRASSIDDSEHHRVTQLLFAADSASGDRLVRDGDELAVTVSGLASGTVAWDLGDSFGADLLGEGTSSGVASGALTLTALFAIFSGMLAALSPCLLLLATYYTAVLAGTTAGSEGGTARASRQLATTSLAFVVGFAIIYTAGGVFAGYVGNSVSRLDTVGNWARPVSIVAGIVVILLGIRVAAQSRVPLVCKMPGFNRPTKKSGFGGSLAMGSTFAVGCLSCFSATVLSALLLYAGATGSPVTGGLIMLTFSAATGLIFLLATYLVARAVPLVGILEKARPYIGGLSAVVMIALGTLMVTYTFHRFTGWIFELWS